MEGAVHLPPGVVALSHPYPSQWWFTAVHPRWTRFLPLLRPFPFSGSPSNLVGGKMSHFLFSVFLVFDSVFFVFLQGGMFCDLFVVHANFHVHKPQHQYFAKPTNLRPPPLPSPPPSSLPPLPP